MRKKHLRGSSFAGVGLGLAIAAVITLFYRSAPFAFSLGLQSVKPFAIGIGTGGFVAGVALALFFAKDSFSEPSKNATVRLAWIAVCCITIGTGLFLGDVDVGAAIGSMPVEGSGMLAGIGAALFFGSWQRRFMTLTEGSLFSTAAIALVVAGLSCGLIAMLPFNGAIGTSTVALIASAALCSMAAARPSSQGSAAVSFDGMKQMSYPDGTASETRIEQQEEASFRLHARLLVSLIWKPLIGSCICAFVIGFTWDTDLIGVPLNNTTLLASEKVIALIASGMLLLVLSHTRSHDRVEVVLLYTILPLALFSFIVRPYFLGSSLPAVALMLIGIAREMGFALFFTATWYAACAAPRKADASPGFVFGFISAACCAFALFGFSGTYLFGSAINMMGAVLFIAYLIAIVVSSTIDARNNRRPLSARDVEGFLEARANAIGDEYGLSPREREILLYLTRGHSYASIAEQLFISENTLRTHARNIYRKVGVTSREGLITLLHTNEDR